MFSILNETDFDNWIQDVETKWSPPPGTFKKSPEEIAKILLENSKSYKQAVLRLNFYVNRMGKNLSEDEKKKFEEVKEIMENERSKYFSVIDGESSAFVEGKKKAKSVIENNEFIDMDELDKLADDLYDNDEDKLNYKFGFNSVYQSFRLMKSIGETEAAEDIIQQDLSDQLISPGDKVILLKKGTTAIVSEVIVDSYGEIVSLIVVTPSGNKLNVPVTDVSIDKSDIDENTIHSNFSGDFFITNSRDGDAIRQITESLKKLNITFDVIEYGDKKVFALKESPNLDDDAIQKLKSIDWKSSITTNLSKYKNFSEIYNLIITIDDSTDKSSITQVRTVLEKLNASYKEKNVKGVGYVFELEGDSDLVQKLRNVNWKNNIHKNFSNFSVKFNYKGFPDLKELSHITKKFSIDELLFFSYNIHYLMKSTPHLSFTDAVLRSIKEIL